MPKYEVSYPTQVPVQAAKDLFGWIKDATLLENRKEAALAAYQVVGYASGMVLGNPDLVNVVGVAAECGPFDCPTKDQALEALDTLSCQPVGATPEEAASAMAAAAAAGKINFGQLVKFLVTVILPLILDNQTS